MQPFARAATRALPQRMVFFHKTGLSDAWRKHPLHTVEENTKISNMFPGLGTAIVLFAAFVAVDKGMAAAGGGKKAAH